MSRRSITLVLFVASVAVAAGRLSAFLSTRAASTSASRSTSPLAQSRNSRAARNIFQQAEALHVSRRLGKRFDPSSRAITTSVADLTLGRVHYALTLVRRQTEIGEDVELQLGDRDLTWNGRQGTAAVSGVPTDTERLLMERLVLDSPDQFVLAQLRGASYSVVTRNMRPPDASDGYTGPLWNLVRVDEPQIEENRRPRGTWRIYYINTQSGLPDRVEYQLNGQVIRAEFMEWTEVNGEKVPSKTRWLSDGQPIMEYRFTNTPTIDSTAN